MSSSEPKNLHVLSQPKKIIRKRKDVSERKNLKKSIQAEIAEYPPSLKQIAEWVVDNNQMFGLKALCQAVFPEGNNSEKRDRKWANVKALIRRQEREHGRDFRNLLVRIAEDMNILQVPMVIQVLYEEAMKGNVRAADLFLKSQGAMGGKGKKEEAKSSSLVPHKPPEFRDPEDWED